MKHYIYYNIENIIIIKTNTIILYELYRTIIYTIELAKSFN